ncbi:helicase associated domain-containing protein [Arthrobacter sp. EH-1B-1]|uniref:Helicase associated domain-containing protein n=1 Tax=Arthrobacter vasquezii TaxID=2977629 RepID=A0ABT6CZQ9_9MICC|nr:helicase associated domain-containing protein [Arthrobacter vasquezii]MDF9279591.1 helicase associated domain-containing protein [Arthrobacter vasquezii]
MPHQFMDGSDDAGEWGPATSREEWLLMYLRGLSIKQIAELCRVKYEKVRLHIRYQERRYPTLLGRRLILHDQPAPAPPQPAAPYRQPWEEKFAQLRTFVRRRRRFPQQLSPNLEEKNLHRWLRYQRARYTDGRMTEEQSRQLDTLGVWRGNVLGDRETHWHTVHTQLLQFIQGTGRMPRRANEGANALEATLDVWIQTQRAKARAGTLTPTRRNTLDRTIPGWNTTRASQRSG